MRTDFFRNVNGNTLVKNELLKRLRSSYADTVLIGSTVVDFDNSDEVVTVSDGGNNCVQVSFGQFKALLS